MLIYVTGKSGSGKSTFSKKLASQLNYKYIDVDIITHKIYKDLEVIKKINQLFGDSIKDENGDFDRKKLGQIVFSEQNSNRVQEFNKFTWNKIKELLEKEITENCVLDYIFLPITELWTKNAIKILVKQEDDNLRIDTLLKRDNITKEYALLRDKSGIEYNENEFDIVIKNDYNEQTLQNAVNYVTEFIQSKA